MRIRAFVAVNIPEPIRAALAEAQVRLRAVPADVSWTAPHNIHVTLKFLGEIGESGAARVGRALEAAAAARVPFAVAVGGFGLFPGKGPPRVLWAGALEGAEALISLQASVERALAALAFPREGRRFTPHLTLGRLRSPRNAGELAKRVADLGSNPLGTFTVDHIDLMGSQLNPKGSIYTVLQEVPLRGR
jgi:RNA 2',3'-cyclic 3'-phosphodiesterase